MDIKRWIATGLLAGTTTLVWANEPPRMAEPNPPQFSSPEYPILLQSEPRLSITATPSVEWTYHRTADGQHPNGDEQALIWLMNRARRDPAVEGRWLATETNSDVAYARDYFKVNTALLQSEFAGYAAKPPAASDARLYAAAKAHSDDLIARDAQDHNQQFDRIVASGFRCIKGSANVFSYAKNALNAHAGWNIDWGSGDGTGMQPGRGHRIGLMAIDGDYANVGLATVAETNPATKVGPMVATGNYCQAAANGVDHFNVFLVGTVWQDKNKNSRYDPGEGYGNVTVRPNQGTYFAMTSAGGGYAIPVTASGAWTVSFSGGGVADANRSVTVGGSSVLLDYQTDAAGPVPNPTPTSTQLTNISTRGWVGTGDSVMIGGFIINGSAPKKVLIIAKGPTLTTMNVPSVLNDPNITLHNASGQVILSNDNWGTAPNSAEIQAHRAHPSSAQEAAILTTLSPGAYTAIVRGAGTTTGNALIEVYDLEPSNTASRLVNISTRGWVGTGDSVMIGGFIINGSDAKKVLIIAKGPSMTGVPSVLNDPNVTLHNASGQVILSNDNWGTATNSAEIQAYRAHPSSAQEAAILTTLSPGAYTAIVRGAGTTTGNALVEVYEVQ